MGKLPEPDDVDFIVAGGDSDPKSLQETIDFIREYKDREEYAAEVQQAKTILDALGIDCREYGMDDPNALLDHWKRCVSDLTENDSEQRKNGRST